MNSTRKIKESGVFFEEGSAKNPDVLLVCPDLAGQVGMPMDEFLKILDFEGMMTIKVFDRSRRFGLAGFGEELPSFGATITMLKQWLDRHLSGRLIICGASGGGHTALLFGHVLKADLVISYAPFPYLRRETIMSRKDPILSSGDKILGALDTVPQDCLKYFDLHEVLSEWNGVTSYMVHYGRFQRDDAKRAVYLKGLPRVKLIAHPVRGHGITRWLSEKDWLRFSLDGHGRKNWLLLPAWLLLHVFGIRYVLIDWLRRCRHGTWHKSGT